MSSLQFKFKHLHTQTVTGLRVVIRPNGRGHGSRDEMLRESA